MAGSSSSSPPSSATPPPPSASGVASTGASSATPPPGGASSSSLAPSAPASADGRRLASRRSAIRGPRLEYVAALLVGLLLVGVQLFFWRRHGATASPNGDTAADAGLADAGIVAAADAGAAAMPGVVVTELRVLECHDRGSKRTPPEECDHLPPLEAAFAKALEQTAACAAGAGGGSVTYTLDVSYLRKRTPFYIAAQRDGRTLKSAKAVAACVSALKKAIAPTPLEGVAHAHARYKISAMATYPGPTDPGALGASGATP